MAVNLLHSLLTCKIKHISFHSYFISWIAILCVPCGWDKARDLKDKDLLEAVFMWGRAQI